MSCLHPRSQQRLGSISQTSDLPTRHSIHHQELNHILGAELYEIIKEKNNINYRNSLFGLVVIGGSPSLPIQLLTTYFSSMKLNTEDTLKNFWEIEELPHSRHCTKEEQACEDHFKDRPNVIEMDKSLSNYSSKKMSHHSVIPCNKRNAALTHFSDDLLEIKILTPYTQPQRNPGSRTHGEDLGLRNPLIESSKSFYLPHHCVLKESSTKTKHRVVFDASAKTTSGVSLNDNMMLGSKIQKNLFDILIRFRFHKAALSAKMYRQILFDTEDKDFHRMLWKESPSSPLKHYRRTRNTYCVHLSDFMPYDLSYS